MKTLFVSLMSMMPLTAFASGGGSAIDAMLSMDTAYKVLNFLILAVLLHIFLKKPLVNAFQASATGTKDELELTQKNVEAKEKQLAEITAKMAEMEKELVQRKNDSLVAIGVEKQRILDDAAAQAKQMQENATKRIASNLIKAKNEIRAFLAEEASNMAEAGIKDKLGASEKKALLSDYEKTINQVGCYYRGYET